MNGWKYLILVATGAAAGWIGNTAYHQATTELPVSSLQPEIRTPVSESAKLNLSNKFLTPFASNIPELPEINQITAPQVGLISSTESKFRPDPQNPENTVTHCTNQKPGMFDLCRQKILDLVASDDILDSTAETLLERWLLDHPNDISASLLLVERQTKNERYVDAVHRLAMLHSYQVEQQDLERVATHTQQLARTALIKLTIKDDPEQLQNLLAGLLDIDPARAAWRFALAKTQTDLGKYEAAINSLTYILFDPDYGDRANTLYDDIKTRINFSEFAQAPLHKSGSQFIVAGIVNGYGELSFLLDTGASITTIKNSALKKLGISGQTKRPILLNTAGGPVYSNLVRIQSLNIGGQTVRQIDVAALDLQGIEADGLLGFDYLSQFRFVIDQKRRTLFLTPKF